MGTKDIHLFANGNDPFILPIHPPDRRVRLPYSRRCPTAHTFNGVWTGR